MLKSSKILIKSLSITFSGFWPYYFLSSSIPYFLNRHQRRWGATLKWRCLYFLCANILQALMMCIIIIIIHFSFSFHFCYLFRANRIVLQCLISQTKHRHRWCFWLVLFPPYYCCFFCFVFKRSGRFLLSTNIQHGSEI